MSLRQADLALSAGLTAITGPNGTGKTTLARVVHLVGLALQAQASNDWSILTAEYGAAGRYGTDNWKVRLGVAFDDIELSLLELWLQGCVITMIGASRDPETTALREFALVGEQLGSCELFTSGVFEVEYDRRFRNPWKVRWFSSHTGGDRVQLALESNVATTAATQAPRKPYVNALRETIIHAQQQAAAEAQGVGQPIPENAKAPTLFDMAASGGVELVLRPTGLDPEPFAVDAILTELGLDKISPQAIVGFAAVAGKLFGESVLGVDNERRPPLRIWASADLGTQPDLASGAGLALALFQDKNGDAVARDSFTRTSDIFNSLTGSEALDVTVQHAPTPGHAAALTLTPIVRNRLGDVPLHLSGAGRSEAAHLAAVLARSHPVLVLDEPATNLSTAAQRRVTAALQERTGRGNQTLLITHSSPLVPTRPDQIVRLTPRDDGTDVTRLGNSQSIRKHAGLLRQVPVRDALFASGVLLTEGGTEADALAVWLRQTSPTLEEAGVLLLDVGGDAALVPHMQVLDAIGVPWAALVDGPALHLRLHHYDGAAPRNDFDTARAFWASRGVHTVAEEFGVGDNKGQGEFEVFLASVDPDAWQVAKAAAGKSKPRAGAAFAQAVQIPERIDGIWRAVRVQFQPEIAQPT